MPADVLHLLPRELTPGAVGAPALWPVANLVRQGTHQHFGRVGVSCQELGTDVDHPLVINHRDGAVGELDVVLVLLVARHGGELLLVLVQRLELLGEGREAGWIEEDRLGLAEESLGDLLADGWRLTDLAGGPLRPEWVELSGEATFDALSHTPIV